MGKDQIWYQIFFYCEGILILLFILMKNQNEPKCQGKQICSSMQCHINSPEIILAGNAVMQSGWSLLFFCQKMCTHTHMHPHIATCSLYVQWCSLWFCLFVFPFNVNYVCIIFKCDFEKNHFLNLWFCVVSSNRVT